MSIQTIQLSSSDVEFLLSYLDEEPQVTRANRIREEILLQFDGGKYIYDKGYYQ